MTTTTSPDALLSRYREIIEAKDRINAQLQTLGKELDDICRGLISFSESSGLTSFANGDMSISVQEKLRAKYDPEAWADIVRWDLETGTGAVQRRLTDAKIISLIEDGVSLPPGLTVEGFKRVSHRRK